MKPIRTTAVLVLLASASLPALADPPDMTDLRRFYAPPPATQKDLMATPAFERLTRALSGDWWVNVKYAPDKRYPDGQKSSGTESWRVGAGGMPLIAQFQTRFAGGAEDTTNSALIWHDASGNMHGLLCAAADDHGCAPINVEWRDNKAILSGELVRGGRDIAWRQEFTFDGAHKFTQSLFEGEKGGELKLVSTASGERQ